MKTLTLPLKSRLPVSCLFGILLTTALASPVLAVSPTVGMSSGSGSREGDPLDGTEPDSGPGTDDNIHRTSMAVGGHEGSIGRTGLFSSCPVLFVPQYFGGALTFQVIYLREAGDRYAR